MGGETDRIGGEAVGAIEADTATVVVSAVSVWEIAIKRGLGKLEAPPDLLPQLERAGVALLPITARHANRVASLPPLHRDPFDRLLIAQAEIEELTLVSADEAIARYDIAVIW